MENRALEFAKAIVDYHVEASNNYHDGPISYVCHFCYEGSITKWPNHEDVSNIASELDHSDDCPVISAKKYIHTLIIEE